MTEMFCISFWLMKSRFLTYSQRALILCNIFAPSLVVVGRCCFLFTAEICSRIWRNAKSLCKVLPEPNFILLLHKGKAANWTHSPLIPSHNPFTCCHGRYNLCDHKYLFFFFFLKTHHQHIYTQMKREEMTFLSRHWRNLLLALLFHVSSNNLMGQYPGTRTHYLQWLKTISSHQSIAASSL